MQQWTPRKIQTLYLFLTLLTTLAASLIWGVNTLFLLDAGLSVTAAFAANAFFTLGMVIFEVPTGVVADTAGRRISFMVGTLTLAASTLFYLWAWQVQAGFWAWALSSILIGLGFTFFSGATEAWLVDALHATGYKGTLEPVFAKGQIIGGIAMLTGSVMGGIIAQFSNLGVPYMVRAALLLLTFVIALVYMRDLGFKAIRGKRVTAQVRQLLRDSVKHGLSNPAVRWMMLSGIFGGGVGIFVFYAVQPYLLELYGTSGAYFIAGLGAAIVAGSQIVGGLIVPHLARWFRRRTTVLITGVAGSAGALALAGVVGNFWVVIMLLVIWGLVFAATTPIRQAYLNGLIPSQQRATVLSFNSLLSSAGGVGIQPALGKAADVWGYGASLVASAVISILAVPFLVLARRTKPSSDPTDS